MTTAAERTLDWSDGPSDDAAPAAEATTSADLLRQAATSWAVGTAGPGSPGASTLALALAVQASGLLVEADPDGGVIGARCGCYLHEDAPSLASLLAALPAGMTADRVSEHTQLLPAGVRAALLGPAGEDAAGPVAHLPYAMRALKEVLPGGHLVLDVGRVRPDSPAVQLIGQVDGSVIVTGASVEGLACLLARLPVLAAATPALVVAVRGSGPYTESDIRTEIHARAGTAVQVVWVPEDPRGVSALLAGRHRPGRRPSRWASSGAAPVLRAAADLHAALTAVLPASARSGTGGGLA